MNKKTENKLSLVDVCDNSMANRRYISPKQGYEQACSSSPEVYNPFPPSSSPPRTSTMGYGQPPEDSISVAVLATIIAGLGIPAVLVLLGAAFVVYKRRPWQNVARLLRRVDRTRTNYETLN